MTNTEILDRLRDANPAPTEAVEVALDADQRERIRAVAIARGGDAPARGDRVWARGARHGKALRIATLAAGAAAVVAIVLSGVGSGGGPRHPEFAAAAIRVAEANPRLLVTAPGWEVTRADEFDEQHGSMTFSDGEHELEMNWYPADEYRFFVNDRIAIDESGSTIDVNGATADLFHYGGSEYAAMLPPQGEVFIEIRGNVGGEQAYVETVQSLRPTDVETWLSAMPPSTVVPEDRAAVVDEMLRGIPLPPAIHLDELRRSADVSDRYQLAARVTTVVACGWIRTWRNALEGGDRGRAQEAVEAMASSRRWPVLLEIRDDGSFAQSIWQYADLMAGKLTGPEAETAHLSCNLL